MRGNQETQTPSLEHGMYSLVGDDGRGTMAETDDQSESGLNRKRRNWRGRLVAVLLIIAGVTHALRPRWLNLDWPSIALILIGILLIFVPLDDIGATVESLEFGKTKILFRKLRKLDESVNRAEIEEERKLETASQTSDKDLAKESGAPHAFDELIQLLLSTDKEMALIRIGVEIERVLAELERGSGSVASPSGIVWSRTMRNLQQNGTITPQMSRALTDFRNVRNQLIHPSAGPVPDSLVTSAVDSGIKLLRTLLSIRGMTS